MSKRMGHDREPTNMDDAIVMKVHCDRMIFLCMEQEATLREKRKLWEKRRVKILEAMHKFATKQLPTNT